MSLARRVIEARRKKEAAGGKAPITSGPSGGVSSFGNLHSSTPLPSAKNQDWGTHGHRTSERATKVHRKHMDEGRTQNTHKRRIIHGGTHGNDYMPPETRGER